MELNSKMCLTELVQLSILGNSVRYRLFLNLTCEIQYILQMEIQSSSVWKHLYQYNQPI